jgi:hypothetical protein
MPTGKGIKEKTADFISNYLKELAPDSALAKKAIEAIKSKPEPKPKPRAKLTKEELRERARKVDNRTRIIDNRILNRKDFHTGPTANWPKHKK